MRNKSDNSERKTSKSQPSSNHGGWLRKHWRVVSAMLVVVVLATAGVWWNARGDEAPTTQNTAQAKRQFVMGPGNFGSPVNTSQEPVDRTVRLSQLKSQVELTEQTYCSYRNGTKYPQESRPISENPDQVYPNHPVEDAHAMRTDGKADPDVQIKTSQSHVYVASGESVVFTVRAVNKDDKTLPLIVTRAIASGVTPRGARTGPQITMTFADDGTNGDAAPGDGTFTGVLTPSATGLAGFNGTVRVEVKYNVGDKPGTVLFDLIYTSETPALWSGPIREAVEDGSLNFYLKTDVRIAGRYIVSGRVDDAKGKPFALVTFNDVLSAGPNEIRLTVFGKLMRDQEPTFPLTLRDVDAYLLKEDTDPDRALMPRIQGTAYVSKSYSPKRFSDSEWHSEERSRYLTELSKDVGQAKDALAKFDPSQGDEPFSPNDCKN
jgi:hypothetical protein